MRTKTWLTLALVLTFIAPILADKRGDAKAQTTFGIMVAQKGLWKEAVARWKKAVEIDETYMPAWNDLAIGYEQLGDFKSAREAYSKGLEINKSDPTLNQNYDLFKELYDAQNRRRIK